MLDKKFLINNRFVYENNIKKRNAESSYDLFENLYNEHKKILEKLEKERSEQNKLSANSSLAKEIKFNIIELSKKEKQLNEQLKIWLLNQPNIILDEVPYGKDDKDNTTIYETFIPDKKSKPHYDLIDNLILKDEANNLSGSRFVVLKKQLFNLKRALTAFLLDHNQENGYDPYDVPYIVNTESLYGTGQLPKFADDAFKLTNDQWLISTGEVPLVNLFANKCFEEKDLPILCTTFTPCFRKEAGSAGRDTKGLIRLHQFHKVELVTICKEEDAEFYHQKQLETAKSALSKLGLPFRVIIICSGDIGFTATKQYDIEVWMPGANKFVEIASCSQCGTFQAMRANIKYKKDKKNYYAHTLNGSSLPLERLMAAIIENYFDENTNSIKIPDILKNYFKNDNIEL